jgi:WD40 repeat protein
VSVVSSLRVAGAVCSIALLRAPSAGASLGFLAATADGVLYRAAFTLAGGASRGAGGAFPAPLGDAWSSQAVPLRYAHGAAGEGLPPAAAAFAGMFPPPLASPSGVTAALASGATAKAASAGALLAGMHGPLQAAMRCPDVLALAFPPHASDVLVSAGSDASVRVWDLNDYACTSVAHVGDAGFPVCVCAGTDLHISGWQDGCVRAWLLKPAPPAMPGAHAAAASGSIIRSGRRAVADAAGAGLGSRGAGVGAAAGPVWAGSPLWFIQDAHPGREGGVTAIALTGAERMLLTGGASGSVRLWDLRSRGLLATFKEHAAAIAQLVVLPGDGIAVSVSRDKTVSTWDLGAQRRLSVGTHPGAINAVAVLPYPAAAFSADGSGAELARSTPASRGGVSAGGSAWGSITLLTCSSTRTVEVWDGARRDPLLVLDYPSAAAAAAEAAARAATGGAAAGSDGRLAATAGEPRAGPEGTCIALPHSRHDMMVTGGTDGRIIFWELPALRVVGAHVATAGAVRDVAFSPDDRQVVATASDGTISVWNVY